MNILLSRMRNLESLVVKRCKMQPCNISTRIRSIRDDPYSTTRDNSIEMAKLASIKLIKLVCSCSKASLLDV